jgi:hypothetical protein
MYGIYDGNRVIAQFVTPMTMRSNRPVFSSDTLSLKRQVAVQGAQRWELTTMLMPLSHTAEELFVNLTVSGHSGIVNIITPQNYGVIQRRTSNSAGATATGSRHSSTIDVKNNIGLIPKGTFIQFSGHSKVYMTTSDLNGSGTVGVFPSLRAAVDNEVMKHRDDVIMPCKLETSTVVGMAYTDGILMDNGTITLLENL